MKTDPEVFLLSNEEKIKPEQLNGRKAFSVSIDMANFIAKAYQMPMEARYKIECMTRTPEATASVITAACFELFAQTVLKLEPTGGLDDPELPKRMNQHWEAFLAHAMMNYFTLGQ